MNPVKEYYDISGMSWDKIGEVCNVSAVQLMRISKRKPQQLLNLKIGTILRMKANLKIDLIKFIIHGL